MLGPAFTVYMAVVVVFMGILMGVLGRYMKVPNVSIINSDNESKQPRQHDCCAHKPKEKTVSQRIYNILEYSFIELPKKIGFEILLGALVASVLVSFSSVQSFVKTSLAGFKGYLILIIIGLIDYVCSTGSVPVAKALIQSGVSSGKSMVYLLMGPVTSYGTLLVIRKEFGVKVLCLYVGIIALSTLLAGLTYDFFLFG
jgi:uncharacterized membrane protein YraQ (UPF0718 family)